MNTETDLETERKHEEMDEAQVDAMENPEAILNDIEQETEEEKKKAIEETNIPYIIDETLEDLRYDYDLNGLYIPFILPDTTSETYDDMAKWGLKWETVRRICSHLKISRNKDKQCEIKYSWVSKGGTKEKGYTYKELMSFTRKNVISDDEIDTIATNLHELGNKLKLEL